MYDVVNHSHPERISHDSAKKIKDDIINWSNMDFPMSVNDACMFEEQNKDISVNIFSLDEEEVDLITKHTVRPLYKSRNMHAKYLCGLLYIQNEEGGHYVL